VPEGGSPLQGDRYRTFFYFAGFVREWSRLRLCDDDLRELESLILADPGAGNVVAGTGGLRKLRFSPSRWRRGKRGALRIGYAHHAQLEKVAVIAVYAKNDQSDLNPTQRREVKRILEAFWSAQERPRSE
jgi:hypothetical protein